MTPKFLQSGALFDLALLALAPLAARADEVMFRGQKIEYGGADLWNGRLARSGSGLVERASRPFAARAVLWNGRLARSISGRPSRLHF